MASISNMSVSFAGKLIKASGLHVMRAYRIPENNINLLELCMPYLLQSKKEIFFVQIGASDGVTNDPLHDLVYAYKLKGLCIEPLPDVFDRLRSNYVHCEGIAFENVAVCKNNQMLTMYRPKGLTSEIGYSQKTSSKKGVVLKHGFAQNELEEIKVKGLSFQTLAEKHQLDSIDLLQVDTEGADYEVIEAVFKSGYYPKSILYESLHLSRADRESCREMLHEKGYSFLETAKDTLAIKKDLLHSSL